MPPLSDDVPSRIIQLLGYQPTVFGNEQKDTWFPFFSSPSTIRRTLEFQDEVPNKVMEMIPCQLDDTIHPELGPTTEQMKVTNSTGIFISEDSIKKCNEIIECKKYKLTMKHEIYNLKQVRSKFHRNSTYTFSRGFSLFSQSKSNVPVTIFTVQDCIHITNKEAKIASAVLQEVAWSVIEGDGCLNLVDFKNISSLLSDKRTGDVNLCLKSMEKMFDDIEKLQIVNNDELNAMLEILARFVSNNGLKVANQKIAKKFCLIFNA